MAQIKADRLSLAFGDNTVFDNLSFSLERGERVGLVGANGTGKSTLFALLAGVGPQLDAGALHFAPGTTLAYLRQEDDGQTLPAHLSGGERTKARLDEVLSQDASLLLLDEPTNHLDVDSVRFLIERLQKMDCTQFIVSHDRYFLDQTVDRILELENGVLHEYFGGYSDYRAQKQQAFDDAMHRWTEEQKRQNALREDITQMRSRAETAHRKSTEKVSSGLKMGEKEKKRARAKKMDKKVKNDVKRLEKRITEGEQRPQKEREVWFRIDGQSVSGKRVIQADHLTKAFGSHVLFRDASFTLCRGDRVALCGRNGSGKTTLLNILLGKEPCQGELWVSPTANPHLLAQDFSGFPPQMTVQDYLRQELSTLGGAERTTLHNLGLTARHMTQPISSLSYGEQMKLKLALPILRQEEFLILDEPTNHLDLPTREQLEETLADYNGTLLIVSHDVYLLRRLCTRVLALHDEELENIPRSYAEYMDAQ